MSRLPPLVIVLAVWAAIYLPALGSFEIKGEEGRRILPAIAMLESGNYVVPQVGSEAYLRKPPLVNWLIAASFQAFGRRSEWTARIPSVLCVLAVAVAFVTIARLSLGTNASTIAALIWLTNLGILGKGRLIEIEALYVSLSALAMICWLSWWEQRRSPWLMWIVPCIFLGLGWLAKGPTHLLFFYAVVVGVLWQTNRWRLLIHPAHFVGILLMLGIFGVWAIPFLQMNESSKVVSKWSVQFTGRITGEFFHVYVWLTTLPRALGYFLPWLLVTPGLRFGKLRDEKERNIARALAWSIAVPLIICSVIPGAAPRYSLPVITPFCWLLGMAFAEDAFATPAWLNRIGRPLWTRIGPVFVGLMVLVGLVGYPLVAFAIEHREKPMPAAVAPFRHFIPAPKVKNIADRINAAVPAQEILYAVNPNYQPFFFYVRASVKYVDRVGELPPDTHYFLVRPENEEKAVNSAQWSPRQARAILRMKDYRKQTIILFVVEARADGGDDLPRRQGGAVDQG
jgi:4-amino-4-deoxy-L-arabinose transferase-like glycosyltransferase